MMSKLGMVKMPRMAFLAFLATGSRVKAAMYNFATSLHYGIQLSNTYFLLLYLMLLVREIISNVFIVSNFFMEVLL